MATNGAMAVLLPAQVTHTVCVNNEVEICVCARASRTKALRIGEASAFREAFTPSGGQSAS
jgi:hypothetical protein